MVEAVSTMNRRPVLKAALALVAACAVLFGSASPASAHAELVTTDPGSDSVVAAAPTEITLQFSERVAVQPDGIRVLTGTGERVDMGTASASGSVATSPLKSGLGDGGYVVSWRAISADGHPIRGSFTFSVGQRTTIDPDVADDAFAGSADRRDEVAGAVLRILTYLAVLGASGAVLVGAGLHRRDEPMPVTRLVSGVALVGVLALVLQLPAQASLATGRGWGSITEEGVLDLAVADGVGPAVVVTLMGLLAMLLTAGLPFAGAVRALALGGAVVAPLGLVITGHTRTMSPAAVGYAADAAHVLAGAVWFGGLIALSAILHRRHGVGDLRGAATAVARFSGWAAISVAVVAVAGLVLGWIEVGGLTQLTSTTYGKLLMVKVTVVAAVGAVAAWNRFRFVPAVADTEDEAEVERAPWGRFRRLVAVEIVGIVAALAITGVLSNVTPAKAAIESGPVSASAEFGAGSMDVTVDPARPGGNDVHVYFLTGSGGVDDSYQELTVTLELPSQEIGPLEVTPVRVGPGHFQVVNTDFPLAGDWTIAVKVMPDRFTEVTGEVVIRVA